SLDAIGAKARPVILASDNHWRLEIPKSHDVLQRRLVDADVDYLVLDAGFVEGLVGGVALHARGLGVDGHAHDYLSQLGMSFSADHSMPSIDSKCQSST